MSGLTWPSGWRQTKTAPSVWSIELLHVDTERPVEVEEVGPDRLAGGVRQSDAREAEHVLDGPVHEGAAEPVEHPVPQGDRPAVEQACAGPPGHLHESPEHPAFHTARILDPDQHLGEHVLVDAGGSEVVGRANLAHVGQHRVARLGAAHAESDRPGLRVREHVVSDPGHRQVGHHLVVFGQPVADGGVSAGDDEVVVRQRDALGVAGRAGGVEDDRDVAALSLCDLRLEEAGLLLVKETPAAEHVLAGDEARRLVIREATGFVVNDVLEAGAAANLQELVHLLLILGDDEADLGLLERVEHLFSDCVLVERDGDAPQALGGRHGPVEAGPVVADQGEPISPGEAARRQTAREGADFPRHVLPGPRLPDAEVLLADRGAPAANPRVVQEELRKRVGIHALSRAYQRGGEQSFGGAPEDGALLSRPEAEGADPRDRALDRDAHRWRIRPEEDAALDPGKLRAAGLDRCGHHRRQVGVDRGSPADRAPRRSRPTEPPKCATMMRAAGNRPATLAIADTSSPVAVPSGAWPP